MPRAVNPQVLIHAFGGRKIWKYNEEHEHLKCLVCPNAKISIKYKCRIKRHATSAKHLKRIELRRHTHGANWDQDIELNEDSFHIFVTIFNLLILERNLSNALNAENSLQKCQI